MYCLRYVTLLYASLQSWALSVFWIFLTIKMICCIFYQVNLTGSGFFLNRTVAEIDINLIKKNIFLLLKKLKNTESAQLCIFTSASACAAARKFCPTCQLGAWSCAYALVCWSVPCLNKWAYIFYHFPLSDFLMQRSFQSKAPKVRLC